MNSFQRVLNTFKGDRTDKIPVYHIGFSSEVASQLLGREAYIGGGIQQWREASALWKGEEAHREFLERSYRDAFDIANLCDMDIIRPSYWRLPVKPCKKLDEYSYLYGDENNWHIRRYVPETELFDVVESYPPKKEESVDDLEIQLEKREERLEGYDPSRDGFEAVRAALQVFGREKVIRVDAGHVDIPMDPVWLEAIYMRPDLVEKHLDLQVRKAKMDADYLFSIGIKYMFGGGDLASNTGPIYSPKTFHDFMLPAVKRIAAHCRRLDMLFLFNSDGNLWPVAEDLFGESGIDGFYEIDRRARMDLAKLRTEYPGLTLLGNISSYTLHKESKTAVIEETLSCIEAAREHGRIIVGCSNYLVPGTPIENAWAMIETINKYK